MSLSPLSVSLCQEDTLEKVINDTECLFKSREKEYQETIDQIEVRQLLISSNFKYFKSVVCFVHVCT